jgi:hypothetical protein
MFVLEKVVAFHQIIVPVLQDIVEWNVNLHNVLERILQMQMFVLVGEFVVHLILAVVQENTLAVNVKPLCSALEKM